jgi:ATP-dependent Clp protease ATP-binding subunit ClpA
MTPPPTLQELIETVRQDARSDQSLDQLVVAAAAADQLAETTDALLGHFVDRCRRDGRSWTEISNALGVSKQAVHKRFAPALAAHIFAATPSPTFERFTDRARHVIAAAQQAARSLGADAVGSEHLLLGLFAEPAGIAGRTLAAMNVSEDFVLAAVRSLQRDDPGNARAAGDAPAAGDARAPGDARAQGGGGPAAAEDSGTAADTAAAYSDDAKWALQEALTVALDFGHNYIGTEHLLLGLYRNPGSPAAAILLDAGALEGTARAHITDILRSFEQGQ